MENEIMVFPASFAQQRLWFLDRLEPGSSTYNIAQAFRLAGPLQWTALERSLNEIVRRHEILRTTFVESESEPKQIIAAAAHLPLRVISLLQIPAGQRETEARRWIEEEAERPFDLTQGPLFRPALLNLDEEEHILLLAMHHIVSDGWSMVVLYRELSSLYEAFCRSEIPALPDLPIQYVDYAVWQRQRLQGEVLEKQLSYWKEQLSDVPVLELPADRPRPAIRTFRGAKKSAVFPKSLCEGLKALGRGEGATLFMTLLASFQTLLHRYTGQDDIVVGSPIAGRTRPEVEELIGLFINTLVFRGDLTGNPSFRDLLARARTAALEAYEHQDLPFEKLVEELNPHRDPSRSPLFQVMFAMQNVPKAPLALTGIGVSPLEIEGGTAKFDLTLFIEETAGSLTAILEYNTDLFEHDTMARMLGHFHTLLQSIVADPEQRLSDLRLLTEGERHRLLVEWNDTRREYPKDRCIHQVFEALAERTPDSIAAVFDDRQLTYRQLNARANRLAHYLKKHGVGRETPVGVCVERSLEMIVGLLGILKAGGAYVPLDPDYPEERVAFMLEDAQAPLLLTEEKFRKQFVACRTQTVCLDSDSEQIARESPQDLQSEVTPGSLAYIIYTSGSTGRPKSVEVCHRGVLRLLFGIDYIALDSGESILQMAPISFDASTFELWGALLHGGRCVLFPDRVPTVSTLGAALRRHRISTLWLTASLYNVVIDEAPEILSGVRQLLIGGEALSLNHVRRGLDLLPSTQIINGYGPTENTTFTCCYRIPKRLQDSAHSVSIGRPIGNTEVYLLDRNLQPTPIGVPGELLIGGDGLARGYLNRPELTAEKFIQNPFNDEPGARLYRTGDLCRYLPDGNIEFLGRIDDQVKIRGFRIEPGEVESALAENPAVTQAVVLVREEPPGEKRLVAYVVSSREPAPTHAELRDFLKKKLPDYMIPSAFVFLKSLPLTSNGKVDRRALPDPGDTAPDRRDYAAPSGLIEQELARIWQDLLLVRPIGVNDDFFDLGGHSLLAVQMMHRIEQACGQRLPLTTLLAGPTIKHLAEALRIQRVEENRSLLVKVQPGGTRPPLFFLHGDFRRGGFYCLTLARCLGPDQPFYALAPHGLNGSSVPDTVEAMAASYIQMVREVQPRGPYLLGGYCNGGTVAFEMARQLRREGQEVMPVVLVAAPARNARAKIFAQRFTDGLGTLFGLGPEEKLRLFLGLRACVRPVRRLVRRARGFRPKHRSETRDLFLRALSTYIPKPYPGRVALFWPGESESLEDANRGWNQAVPHMEVLPVPGDHVTCVAIHADVLGARMKTYFEQAQGKSSCDRTRNEST